MKKAQAWGFDLMIASSLFLFGIIVFFLYSLNSPQGEQEKAEDLLYEGNLIANDIMSAGYPENWRSDTVTKIGLTSNNKINQTKLELFKDLAELEYAKTRSLFDTKYHYFINSTTPFEIEGQPIAGIGNQPTNAQNIMTITRFTIYNDKSTTLKIQIWD